MICSRHPFIHFAVLKIFAFCFFKEFREKIGQWSKSVQFVNGSQISRADQAILNLVLFALRHWTWRKKPLLRRQQQGLITILVVEMPPNLLSISSWCCVYVLQRKDTPGLSFFFMLPALFTFYYFRIRYYAEEDFSPNQIKCTGFGWPKTAGDILCFQWINLAINLRVQKISIISVLNNEINKLKAKELTIVNTFRCKCHHAKRSHGIFR